VSVGRLRVGWWLQPRGQVMPHRLSHMVDASWSSSRGANGKLLAHLIQDMGSVPWRAAELRASVPHHRLQLLIRCSSTPLPAAHARTPPSPCAGGGHSTGFGLIYDSKADMLKFEPRYRLIRTEQAVKKTRTRKQWKDLKKKKRETWGTGRREAARAAKKAAAS
jgi:hypothetical protein